MRIVVTGADGFIGKNLRVRLRELGYADVVAITSASTAAELNDATASADFVFHLAGVNRPKDPGEFATGNAAFTWTLCNALAQNGRRTPVAFASSTQAALDNPYGRSKKDAEDALRQYARASAAPVHLFRLANVFGKWCRPFYNSAVATFCHSIARGLPITVNDPAARLQLVYIDDVVAAFVRLLGSSTSEEDFAQAGPVHTTTVGELARTLQGFAADRESRVAPRSGAGLVRALYATYISHLPVESFAYALPRHTPAQGETVEMLRTPEHGQFSYFTVRPGDARGEHYHHSKTEKFLVVHGSARFGMRHIETGQLHGLTVHGGEARIVESVPGWAHDIANVGRDELVVVMWASEIFDPERPDTVAARARV